MCMHEWNKLLLKKTTASPRSFLSWSFDAGKHLRKHPRKHTGVTRVEEPICTSDPESSASAAAGSSSSSSSVEERTSNQLSDLLDDFENVIPREQVVYSSRRLTEQQILRLNPWDAVTVFIFRDHDDSDPKIGPHFVTFEGYGAIGLDSCFLLRRV